MSAATDQRVLVSISISHYCEKARWALDRAGLDYEEQRHLPALHRVAAWRAGRGLTVPVLVCRDRVVTESVDILRYADEFLPEDRRLWTGDPAVDAEADALAARFDDELGPHTRRWVYFHTRGRRGLVAPSICDGVPAWQRRTFALTYRPITFLVSRVLDITPATAAESEREFRRIVDDVGERLADGRRFLVGDRFSAADLTFAALAAPLVRPPEYGVELPAIGSAPPAMTSVIRELRDHPAGEFALRLFREERVAAAARA